MTAPDKQRAAAALANRPGEAAPRVVAKGRGILADTIIERARASGVYVHESRELLALLMQIDLDSHIPPQLYIAVAGGRAGRGRGGGAGGRAGPRSGTG